MSVHRLREGPHGPEWSILYNVVGRGTAWLASRQPGDSVFCWGPLGQGFAVRRTAQQLLLVAGGIFYLDLDRPDEALRWLDAARQTRPESLADQGQSWRSGGLEDYLGLANLLCGQLDCAQCA